MYIMYINTQDAYVEYKHLFWIKISGWTPCNRDPCWHFASTKLSSLDLYISSKKSVYFGARKLKAVTRNKMNNWSNILINLQNTAPREHGGSRFSTAN